MNTFRQLIWSIEESIMTFCKWLYWLTHGKKVLTYSGYHCGCCGRWTEKKFSIPTYKSDGSYWDTIGLCPNECKEIKSIKY